MPTIGLTAALSLASTSAAPNASWTASITQAGTKFVNQVQTVGIAAEVLDKGDIGTMGYYFVKNTDSTNFVELATDAGMVNIFGKLLPGECCVIASRNVPYLRADTAPCDCLVFAIEL